MNTRNLRIITLISALLAISLAVVSFFGIFVPETYARDTASMAAQGVGQDIINLFLVVPLLMVSMMMLRRKSIPALYIFGGTLFYVLYSFIIYCFGVHFNNMFLLYCLTLGLAVYLFIILIHKAVSLDVLEWHNDKLPEKVIGIYLVVISLLFYLLWLKDIVPAILNNAVPSSVSDYDLLVNPVHVIDISFALPGLIISAVLIMKKDKLGYILVPVSLVFIIILAIALAMMAVMMKIRGITGDISLAGIFIILAFISLMFLIVYLTRLDKKYFSSG